MYSAMFVSTLQRVLAMLIICRSVSLESPCTLGCRVLLRRQPYDQVAAQRKKGVGYVCRQAALTGGRVFAHANRCSMTASSRSLHLQQKLLCLWSSKPRCMQGLRER